MQVITTTTVPLLVATLLVGACAETPGAPSHADARPPDRLFATGAAPLCTNVRDYGAPSGGDDRPAIQSAINDAIALGYRAVCIPAGTYRIRSSSGPVAPAALAGFDLDGLTDFQFIGAGPASVIRVDFSRAGDFFLFWLRGNAARVRFTGLTLDGAGAAPAGSAQQHLLQIGGGGGANYPGAVTDIDVENVAFRNSPGDGVKLAGSSPNDQVTGVNIHHCRFSGNRRNGITFREGTSRVQFQGNYLAASNNSELDFEPGSSSTGELSYYQVSDNLLVHTSSSIAVSLTGADAGPLRNTRFAGNVVLNGSVDSLDVDGLAFVDNVIVGGTDPSASPELRVMRYATNLRVDGNLFVRDAPTGESVKIINDGTGTPVPQHVSFANNSVVQATPANLVTFESVSNLSVRDNLLRYTGATAATFFGIKIQNTASSIDTIAVDNNLIVGNQNGGSLFAGVRVASYSLATYAISNLAIRDNTIRGASYIAALEATGTGTFSGYPVIAGNTALGASSDVYTAGANAPVAWIQAGNSGGAAQYSGNGSPASVISAPVGSIFLRRNGGAGSTLYVKESGTGATGWVAK